MNLKRLSKTILLLPIIGIVVFVGFYIYASLLYPGSSQADINSQGFDWVHNYWCDLMGAETRNGLPNAGSFYAILGTGILGISLAYFFYLFPIFMPISRHWNTTIRLTGMISMGSAILVFTPLHDFIILFSGAFALVALAGIFIGLVNHQLNQQLWLGIICIILIGCNNYFYFLTNQLTYLPLLQKITLVLILVWIVGINLKFLVKAKAQ